MEWSDWICAYVRVRVSVIAWHVCKWMDRIAMCQNQNNARKTIPKKENKHSYDLTNENMTTRSQKEWPYWREEKNDANNLKFLRKKRKEHMKSEGGGGGEEEGEEKTSRVWTMIKHISSSGTTTTH